MKYITLKRRFKDIPKGTTVKLYFTLSKSGSTVVNLYWINENNEERATTAPFTFVKENHLLNYWEFTIKPKKGGSALLKAEIYKNKYIAEILKSLVLKNKNRDDI